MSPAKPTKLPLTGACARVGIYHTPTGLFFPVTGACARVRI